MTTSLALAAPGPVTASPSARTITGLAVPYGPAGQTSSGRLTFAAGALRWSEPRRVKLLREHDQRDVVGYATQLVETPDGLVATFTVPEGPAGDAALREAASGLRDAFSVGVQLDDVVAERLRRSTGQPVRGEGALREVSLVSVPAFDDARVGAVAAGAAQLVVSSWTDPTAPPPPPDPDPGVPTVPDTATPDAPAAPAPTAPARPAPTAGAPAPAPVTTAAASTAAPAAPGADPSPAPLAVAGAALVTGAPATYTFDGGGPSLVRDAFLARTAGDPDAAARLSRWNAELTDGNPRSNLALAAVVTRDTPGVDPAIPPPSVRPLVTAIDLGRPIASRLNRVPISNAQPFSIPVEGEFRGVDLHTEGTPHVPEGTYTLTEQTITPRAVSGAFRVSRELVDASNPAIDRLAVQAMLRDYRRVSEGRIVAALAASDATATTVSGVNGLRAELVDFVGDDDTPASFVASGRGFWSMLAADLDADGRPLLPYVGPTNAAGTVTRAGWTGANVEGVELIRASSLPAGEAYVLDADAVLVCESATQTFRFDEVEGPGIVKLALWGYLAAAVTRADGVRRLARPAPAV